MTPFTKFVTNLKKPKKRTLMINVFLPATTAIDQQPQQPSRIYILMLRGIEVTRR